MNIICTECSPIQLAWLKRQLKSIYPEANIYAFWKIEEATECAEAIRCDILVTEIEFYGSNINGINLAEVAKRRNPRVNIIFATVCAENEHAHEVMRLRPSGYLTKVYDKNALKSELDDLRYPVEEVKSSAC